MAYRIKIGNTYLSNKVDILQSKIRPGINIPLVEQTGETGTYTLSPVPNATTYYRFTSPLSQNLNMNMYINNILNSQIGDRMVWLFNGDETFLNSNSISINLSDDFYITTCGSRETTIPINSEYARIAIDWTFDGVTWTNSGHNC